MQTTSPPPSRAGLVARPAWRWARRTWRGARRTWWIAPACWVLVVVLDVALRFSPSYAVTGMLDEPAHFATTLIFVLALGVLLRRVLLGRGLVRRGLPASFVVPALLMGNLIDLDHLPLVFGDDALTAGTPRPYSHSLATVAVLGLGALLLRLGVLLRLARWGPVAAWRSVAGRPSVAAGGPVAAGGLVAAGGPVAVLAGAAFGVSCHLFRDLGTAPVALFWPVTDAGVEYPELLYLVLLAGLALVAVRGAVVLRGTRLARTPAVEAISSQP